DAAGARVLEATLRGAGFTVQLAASGETALAAMARRPPDVALVATRLSADGDGLELAAKIREADGSSLPLVLLTARRSKEEEGIARDLGLAEPLLKPVLTRELLGRIDAA